MNEYFKERYKTYCYVIIGVILGFIMANFLFDNPDYTTAIIILVISLVVGELSYVYQWKKTNV